MKRSLLLILGMMSAASIEAMHTKQRVHVERLSTTPASALLRVRYVGIPYAFVYERFSDGQVVRSVECALPQGNRLEIMYNTEDDAQKIKQEYGAIYAQLAQQEALAASSKEAAQLARASAYLSRFRS